MLAKFPALQRVVDCLDRYLASTYPDFFGRRAEHPFTPLKPFKVIHDNLWGTNRFNWRELALIDSPILQRLRGIHQTGLAYYVYPSAHHTRFEHTLGVVTIASRTFDALAQRNAGELHDIATSLVGKEDAPKLINQWRAELRMAALLHDTGHSIHSHASEMVYGELVLLKEAANELSTFVGRRKGAGEVISFCISRTTAVSRLLKRAESKLKDGSLADEMDLENVSLLIVGRSKHPWLQFLGDIISSDLDADKLDYLLRDAIAAGLPMRYDLERYLYTVGVATDVLPDGEGYLEALYRSMGVTVARHGPAGVHRDPYYETYRLRLPRAAMSTIEQIVICKFMLFSYIYHHKKVRAAEGLLGRMLRRAVQNWRAAGDSDEIVLAKFMNLTDSALDGAEFLLSKDKFISSYCQRLRNRLLPREVYGFVAKGSSHAEGARLADFISVLLDPARREGTVASFEHAMGEDLRRKKSKLGKTANDALWNAGVWLDVPKPPKFENIHLLIGDSSDPVSLSDVFPIEYWIQAYEAHRYHVRVFAFSEHVPATDAAVQAACNTVANIRSQSFFQKARRTRR